MNTKDLAYFDELISQKNFSKVAKTFGVSQPTVTTAIKRLESEFGAPLVIRDRVKNTLHVTASGAQLAEHAKSFYMSYASPTKKSTIYPKID